ncbi:MAG: phosphoribosylformylglycinamidine cyclo-ligase [Dehalococcoidia bacterium]
MTNSDERPGTGGITYAGAGVDIDAAEQTVRRYGEIARRTAGPEVLSGVGPFAGLFRLAGYRDPVLAASADGVGTKLVIAGALGRYDSVGRDLVNHCTNDILPSGAEPLFFLDYLASADLSQEARVELVGGVGAACEDLGIALIGGETADLPDVYLPGVYDLAGFIVGAVERDEIIDGSRLAAGDALIALPSSGLQTNGYSLVREIWGVGKGLGDDHDREVLETRYEELGGTLGDALLAVHGCFLEPLRPLLARVHAIAHITGGGIPGNLSRIFPDELGAVVDPSTWEVPALFELIRRTGGVEDGEMWRTFNMGAGLIVAVDAADAESMIAELPGAWRIGEVAARGADEPAVVGLEGPGGLEGRDG